jgi:regulator of RNase E activity RraA
MIYSLGDFPYFTRGTTPNAYGGWRILDVNVPIYMPGHMRHYVIVNPGDFIFGDDDGLQVIPKDYVDHVLLIAEAIYAQEIEQRDIIRDGASLDDVYKYFGDL